MYSDFAFSQIPSQKIYTYEKPKHSKTMLFFKLLLDMVAIFSLARSGIFSILSTIRAE